MKAFNPDRELYKIQHGNRNKIILFVILLLIVGIIGYSFALYQIRYSKRIIYTKVGPFSNKDINILAVYLDNQPTSDFPVKNSGYRYDHIECDNGGTATFDNINWELVLRAKKKDKCSVYFVKTYKDASGANAPELYQGLIPVTFDTSGNIKVADVKSTIGWYNYGSKQWANAVLVDSANYDKYVENGEYKSNTTIPMAEILQMYVWIPRYKYQLFNVENGSIDPIEIQIQFENNTSTTGTVSCTNEKGKETCENAINGNWYTHPAFKFGDTDLTGIWVGKFDTSGEATALTIKPNLSSLRSINVYTMFSASRNIEKQYASNFNLKTEEIDTHMMKNMEWGAMAYLTHSKYGRCDGLGTCIEVASNARTDYITGYNGTTFSWETTNGQLASITGNLYGIYDTNGGAWEYVMGVTINNIGNDIYYSESGFTSNTKPDPKYYDLYEYDTVETAHARGHLGDATRETLKIFGNNYGSWYNDYAIFPHNTTSWFIRSGHHEDGSRSGTFTFHNDQGEAIRYRSFRVILTAQDGDS